MPERGRERSASVDGLPSQTRARCIRQQLEAGTLPGDLPNTAAVIAAYAAGARTVALATRLGVSRAAVGSWLRVWGADLRRAGVPPRPDGPAVVAAYVAGESTVAIARRLGMSKVGVAVLLRRAGVPLRGPRLPRSDAGDIAAAYAAGRTLAEVAAAFGTSITTAHRLVRAQGVVRRGSAEHRRAGQERP